LAFEIWNPKSGSKARIIAFSLILAMPLMMGVAGCGRKSSPVPWESIVPRRVVDLVAVPREGHLLLGWTAPKENTDKSPLTDLAEFQILRSEGVLVADECKGCGEKPKAVYEMKLDSKEDLTDKKMSVPFENLEPRRVYVFQVVSINRRGYPSAPSNPVTVFWDHPPPAPGRVRADPGDKRVHLHWEPVEGATGYNIYRKREGEEFPLRPLNRTPLREIEYIDLTVKNEMKYIYSVRAVKEVAKTDVEGTGSPDLPVTPAKFIPPGSPTGIVAIPLKDGIELNWKRNPEADLLGYNVYRRKVGEKEFEKLTPSPSARLTYLDSTIEPGREYEYAVTAVDDSPRRNESPRSEEVRIKALD